MEAIEYNVDFPNVRYPNVDHPAKRRTGWKAPKGRSLEIEALLQYTHEVGGDGEIYHEGGTNLI